jgi:hypothetical protein
MDGAAVQHATRGPLAQSIPPAEGPEAARIILEVFTTCARLMREGANEALIAEADRLALFTNPSNASSTRLFAIRMWKIDALISLGRGHEAAAYLTWLENFNGKSFVTRERMAMLHSFAGEYQSCVDVAAEAIMAMPLGKQQLPAYRSLCQLRAEALCMMGRHDEALHFLLTTLQSMVVNNDVLSALRQAIKTPQALETMFTHLAPHFSYIGHRARVALYHYSIACRDNGMIDRAIFAARQRFLSGLQIVRWGEREIPVKENWSRLAATALVDMQIDLRALGLEFFLVSGTLLGCVRDRDIIGHDKDVDVGVFTDLSPEAVRRHLSRTGRFKIRPLTTDRLVQARHLNGVMIDVFFHWRDDGRVYHEGQKAQWWNSDFALQEAAFLDRTFLIPTDPERYLVENYGRGWRVPEPEFETFVDTPNMMIQDQEHMVWYYYTKLHDYYYAGKPAQLRKVWRALQKLVDGDRIVGSAVTRILSTHAPEHRP